MFFTAVPMFFSFLFAFTLVEPPYKRLDVNKESYMSILKSGVKYFKEYKILRIMTLDRVFIYGFVFAFFWSHQLVLQDINVALKYFGLVIGIMTFIEIIILNNLNRIDKFLGSKKKLIFLTGFIPGMGALLVGVFRIDYLSVILIIVTLGIGFSRDMVFMNYMNKHIESHNRSTVLSVISMMKSIASAIIFFTFGYLIEWDLYISLIIIGSIMIIVSFVSKVEEKDLID